MNGSVFPILPGERGFAALRRHQHVFAQGVAAMSAGVAGTPYPSSRSLGAAVERWPCSGRDLDSECVEAPDALRLGVVDDGFDVIEARREGRRCGVRLCRSG